MSSDALTIGLIMLMLAFGIEVATTRRILYRHQKALEWFVDNINLSQETLPANSPPELKNMVGKEDDKDIGKK